MLATLRANCRLTLSAKCLKTRIVRTVYVAKVMIIGKLMNIWYVLARGSIATHDVNRFSGVTRRKYWPSSAGSLVGTWRHCSLQRILILFDPSAEYRKIRVQSRLMTNYTWLILKTSIALGIHEAYAFIVDNLNGNFVELPIIWKITAISNF